VGFWNALSVLAPIAPAMSDAQDIRTQRTQDAAKFALDEQLKQAQLTAQKLAAQGEQQILAERARAVGQPIFKEGSSPEFNPDTGTYTQPAWSAAKGAYEPFTVPGVSPEAQEKYRLDSFNKNRAVAKGMMPPGTPDETLDYIAATVSGMKAPPASKFTQLTGADGQAQLGPDGKYYVYGKDAAGNIVANPAPPGFKPPSKTTNPYLDWKAQNPNGTVDQYEAMIGRTRVNAAGGPGSWTMAEGADGGTTLYNSKTGETRQAPDGLHKSGYYTKNIAPLEAAKLNVTDYINNGVFDGPGDLSLQHAFFTATQPSAGFRMTKIQQDTLQNSRGWLGGLEARARHAQTGEWYTPEQRKQIADAALSAIADKEKALQGITPPKAPAGGGKEVHYKIVNGQLVPQ
jgi:hypothetical protein